MRLSRPKAATNEVRYARRYEQVDGWGKADDRPTMGGELGEVGLPLEELARRGARDDNLRARRYIAKYTINPAIAHEVGPVEVGKLAGWLDLYCYR